MWSLWLLVFGLACSHFCTVQGTAVSQHLTRAAQPEQHNRPLHRTAPRRRSLEVESLLARYYSSGGFLPPPLSQATSTRAAAAESGDGAIDGSGTLEGPAAADARYRQRAMAAGGDVEVWAYDEVSDDAIRQAVLLTGRMLTRTPRPIRDRLRALGARIAVIGRRQRLTDLPPFRYLATFTDGSAGAGTTSDGRTWASLRGVGGVAGNPTTAVGEEDLLETYDEEGTGDGYGDESVFVHELAHAVMNLGLDACQLRHVRTRYMAARASGAYDNDAYIMYTIYEYFAVTTSIIFDAVLNYPASDRLLRTDELRARDPDAIDMLDMVYGHNPWRYPDDCPRCRTVWPWYYLDLYTPRPGAVRYAGYSACPVLKPRSGCADLNAIMCPYWADMGMCTSARNMPYMDQNCKASCGACPLVPASPPPPPRPPLPPSPPPRAPCADADTDCPFWAQRGDCEASVYTPYMLRNCRVSCNLCGTGPSRSRQFPPAPAPPPPVPPRPQTTSSCKDRNTTYCPSWAQTGYCTNPQYDDYMTANCKLSCGLCSQSSCEENDPTCPDRVLGGECENNRYMQMSCAVSCGLCGEPRPVPSPPQRQSPLPRLSPLRPPPSPMSSPKPKRPSKRPRKKKPSGGR